MPKYIIHRNLKTGKECLLSFDRKIIHATQAERLGLTTEEIVSAGQYNVIEGIILCNPGSPSLGVDGRSIDREVIERLLEE